MLWKFVWVEIYTAGPIPVLALRVTESVEAVRQAFPECISRPSVHYIVFHDSSRLQRKNVYMARSSMEVPKTSAVVGNLRIKDVAGNVVLESSHTYCTLQPLWY